MSFGKQRCPSLYPLIYSVCRISPPDAEKEQLTQACFDNGPVLVQSGGGKQPGERWWYFDPKQPEGSIFRASTELQLPGDLQCDGVSARCVVQAHYVTGNTCTRPSVPPQWAVQGIPKCTSGGAGYPEVCC